MAKRTLKKGFEFSLNGKHLYKITEVLTPETFLAIYIGDYSDRDMVTYNGFTRHGDFRSDRALFSIKEGKITLDHYQATGSLAEAIPQKEAIGR